MFLKSPVHLAQFYWQSFLKPGDCVLDATCGAGKDSLFLAHCVLKKGLGALYLVDIQKEALQKTQKLLKENFEPEILQQVHYQESCHSKIDFEPDYFDLIVYNLGYLPGSDKSVTTQLESSLKSFEKALTFLKSSGYLSLTCYPGHESGALETQGVLEWAKALPKSYSCCHHKWLNRSSAAPNLILIQKN